LESRTDSDPPVNRLIEALPRKDRQHLLGSCEQVRLKFADVLCEPGTPARQVYFPTDSIVSLIMPVAGHPGLEVGLVGNEGLLGIPMMLGVDVWPLRAVVQGAGPAWRMPAARFRQALVRSVALRRRLHRYVYISMRQLAQSAVCARFHVVEARLARWLLMTQDRAHADVFDITQEFLANMLGVRRVGVTEAAGVLQRKHLISYRRGHITVLDRSGLEGASCACYRVDKEVYGRVMGQNGRLDGPPEPGGRMTPAT
jgi:CRP-like cAMP-binding protein